MADKTLEPVVARLIDALNAGDREAFFAELTSDATMSDDGTDEDLAQWADREIFLSHGQLHVESTSNHGLSVIGQYRNDTWGDMRTRWDFTVVNGKIRRFETGQA